MADISLTFFAAARSSQLNFRCTAFPIYCIYIFRHPNLHFHLSTVHLPWIVSRFVLKKLAQR